LNVDSATFLIEVYVSFDQRIDREVVTHADIATWTPFGSDLAKKNVTWRDVLATKLFDASTLGIRIATVSRGALSFFVCHDLPVKNAIKGYV
jgi:hypothetical protein